MLEIFIFYSSEMISTHIGYRFPSKSADDYKANSPCQNTIIIGRLEHKKGLSIKFPILFAFPHSSAISPEYLDLFLDECVALFRARRWREV